MFIAMGWIVCKLGAGGTQIAGVGKLGTLSHHVKKKNVKSLGLINPAQRHEDMWGWRYGSTILNFGTRWR
jgi:hypothetical protein